MIDQIYQRLTAWVQKTLGPIELSFDRPEDRPAGSGINLYLLDMIDTPSPRGTKRAPLQLSLHYLVTSWAGQPAEAHRLLSELAFAAMEYPEIEVEFKPLAADLWLALDIKPRPAFVLKVPLRKERPEPVIKYVRQPIIVQALPAVSLSGVILTPDDVPIANAQVELAGTHTITRTNANGQFRFAMLPAASGEQTLLVRAKGREMTLTVKQPDTDNEALVVHVNLLEGRED
jgi:hypothetical protein